MGMNETCLNSAAQANAQQASCTGGFELACSADTAFPLFSPEGERAWAVGWDPQPVFPDQIVFERNTVFRLGTGNEEAIWTILDADWHTHRAEYVRLAPASHTARIVVQVDPLGVDRCHVTVSYVVTAFGAQAPAQLEPFSEASYAERMLSWRAQIQACLKG